MAFTSGPGITPGTVCVWNQTFNDNFDGTSLNSNLWSTQYPSGNGGEAQYYGPDAFSLGNGILNIIAQATPANGYPYTSGILISRDKFSQQFGRFIIRARLPQGKGFWPAFWLLPETQHFPYEIDVFEMLGHDPNTVYLTYHWAGRNGRPASRTFTYKSNHDYSSGFHTFMVEWDPSEIAWYVDGIKQFSLDQNVPHEPLFMLVNLAVGGHWGGYPNSSTKFPGVMQVDYVRAYEKVCGGLVDRIPGARTSVTNINFAWIPKHPLSSDGHPPIGDCTAG